MKTIHTVLILALVGGLFTRAYQFRERFVYAHDNDLASWIAKDIVVDKHLRLVGQLTSSPGIFIGPLFYYTLIPFYLSTHMDPLGIVVFSWIIGLCAIASIYFVFSKLYGSLPAKIASLVYALSFSISQTEREVVPTAPVMLWTIWFLYAIHRLFAGQKNSLIILAVLGALIWHINLALGLLAPLALLGIFHSRKVLRPRDFLLPVLIFAFLSLPLIYFEASHQFQQTRSLISTLSSLPISSSVSFADKFIHTLSYIAKNVNLIFLNITPTGYWLYLLPALLFIWLIVKFPRTRLLYSLWIGFYLIFFTLQPLNLSEYYLHGLNIVWIISFVSLLTFLFRAHPVSRILATILTSLFVIYHVHTFLVSGVNAIGYIQKKQLIEYIRQDAQSHGYPCIAVSYMTDVGYNFGYRYFFWRAGLHVNQPNSGSPVYTIVYPHSRANRLDQAFGSLGLVLPQYDKYTPDQVRYSCSGQDSNLTDPMFGFTK